MAEEIRIHDVRYTFVWTDLILDALADRPPADMPYAFLGRQHAYADHFDRAIRGERIDGRLTTPWLYPTGQNFWEHYLGGKRLSTVTGAHAWKWLVPFRADLQRTVDAAWLPAGSERISLEGFHFPHGVGVVTTARCRGSFTIDETIATGYDLLERPLTVRHAGGGAEQQTVDALVHACVESLRRAALGRHAGEHDAILPRFSVVTVVRATGMDPLAEFPAGGRLHRMCEALSEWPSNWPVAALTDLEAACLPVWSAAPGRALYACRRGRVVWFPWLAAQPAGERHSLSCYHRNLTLTALYVESLGRLLSTVAEWLDRGRNLPVNVEECARLAAGIAGRLYGGAPSTYRTRSARAHIEQNNFATPIDAVRTFFDMTPLH